MVNSVVKIQTTNEHNQLSFFQLNILDMHNLQKNMLSTDYIILILLQH